MYTPSETVCKLVLLESYEHIRDTVAEQTGVAMSKADVIGLWKQNGKDFQRALAEEFNSVVISMYRAGLDYGRDKKMDCYIEFMNADKQFFPGISKQVVEHINIPDAEFKQALQKLSIELYEFLFQRRGVARIAVEEDGVMYLDCTDPLDPSHDWSDWSGV